MLKNKIINYVLLFFIIAIVVGFIFVTLILLINDLYYKINARNSFTASLVSGASENVEIKNDLDIDAKSVISLEVDNGQDKILLEKNKEKQLPIASLTKLMTAAVVLDKYELNKRVFISNNAMSQIGDQGNLKIGEVLSVKNLLYIMLIESSNRAAYALAEVMGYDKFVSEMNKKAQSIGMLNTYFADSTGLNPKSYSTVLDLAKLSKHLFENYHLFGEIINTDKFNLYLENGNFHHELMNTNQLLGEETIVGGKTGFTEQARGCFMVIEKNPNDQSYIINVILGSEDRLKEMKKLVGFNH